MKPVWSNALSKKRRIAIMKYLSVSLHIKMIYLYSENKKVAFAKRTYLEKQKREIDLVSFVTISAWIFLICTYFNYIIH